MTDSGIQIDKEIDIDKGTSLCLNANKVAEEMLPQHGDVNPAQTARGEPFKPQISPVEIAPPEPDIKSPGAPPPSTGDIDTIQVNHNTSHSDQKDTIMVQERSLEVKVNNEMTQERKDGVAGVELAEGNETKEVQVSNELTPLGSSSGNDPMDETLTREGKGMVFLSNNESEEKSLTKETTGLELSLDIEVVPTNEVEGEVLRTEMNAQPAADVKTPTKTNAGVGNERGTEEEQTAFMKELEIFHKERSLEFKPPKFYGEPLNCLKLWRAVIKLGGYEQVTSCKLWRQVGESFNPPKTCTTVSWTFRGFYEKALLEYEKHKMRSGELPFTDASLAEPSSIGNQAGSNQASGSGRARRDAAARAMQGWHSQRLLGNGEVGDPLIKDKSSVSMSKREKPIKSVGLLKRKRLSPVDHTLQVKSLQASKPQVETTVVDIGPSADWVKINVQRTKDCFEVYALVPGLLREEVRVQSDPAGRLVISGEPEQLDNPWGVTPFKKVVSLPSRIDPHQTSAVVTLHGQLFVRVPFEQADM